MRIRRITHTLPFAALIVLAACGNDTSDAVGGPAPAANTAVTLSSPAASTPSPADAPVAAPASGESVVLTRDQDYSTGQSGTTVSITCDGGGDITVDADDVQVRATGNCEDIDVDGNRNSVVAENIEDLDVDGDQNTVRVGGVTDIEVDGNGNTITYGGGNPSIENEGDNVVAVG